jgi:DNA topoisomerase VI subunit A
LDCLKVPIEYKKNNIELWYVGGNNTKPLIDISPDKLNLPIFYFCDWDYHGLSIYSKVKDIFKSKNKEVTLVKPKEGAKRLPVEVKHHKSSWNRKCFSDLKKDDYTADQIALIDELISRDEWIEEESMDLIELMKGIN